MLQLAFFGPPTDKLGPSGRERLRRRVERAVQPHLSTCGLAREDVDTTIDLVVEALTKHSQGGDQRRLMHLLYGDQPACWICGFKIAKDAPPDSHAAYSIDHIVPRSAGGGHLGLENLRPAHRFCNSLRTAKRLKDKTRERYRSFLERFSG